MSPPFVSPDIPSQKSDQEAYLKQCFDYFYNNSVIFEASIDQKYGKSPLLAWSFSSAISGPGVGPSSLYMGYSQKVEGSSFPMVVVSDRMALRIQRNFNLKMGFFQTKNRHQQTIPWANSTKNLPFIGLLEVHQMLHLDFTRKKFLIGF